MKKRGKPIYRMMLLIICIQVLFCTAMSSSVAAQPSLPEHEATATEAPAQTSTPQENGAGMAAQESEKRPLLILKKYEYSDDVLSANSKAEITLTIQNIGKESANTVYIKIQSEGDIIPADNINRREVGQIGSRKSKSISIPIAIQNHAKPGAQKITVSLDYANTTGDFFSTTEEILCQIKQPLRISCDTPPLPARGYAGDTISVPVNVVNLGQSALYNVMCTIEGEGLFPQSSLFLGTVEQGTSGNGEIYVFLGAKEETQQAYGPVQGMLKIIYEDEYGASFEKSVPLSTLTIEAPRAVATEAPKESEEKQTAGQWWVTISILAVVILGIVAGFLYKNHKRKRGRHDEDG